MFAVALSGAVFAFFFRHLVAIGLLVLALLVAGIISFEASPDTLQGFLMIATFGSAFLFGSAALGIAAGTNLRNRKFRVAALLFIPFPLVLWCVHSNAVNDANEEQQAHAFVTSNEQLKKLIGGPVSVYPTTSDSNGRYEFSIRSDKELYAIVDSPRSSGQTHFRLTCVTTLYLGHRESGKDACAQATVQLPE